MAQIRSWLRAESSDRPLESCRSLNLQICNNKTPSTVSKTRRNQLAASAKQLQVFVSTLFHLPRLNENLGRSCLSSRVFLLRPVRRASRLAVTCWEFADNLP